jgi:hypothetical protein
LKLGFAAAALGSGRAQVPSRPLAPPHLSSGLHSVLHELCTRRFDSSLGNLSSPLKRPIYRGVSPDRRPGRKFSELGWAIDPPQRAVSFDTKREWVLSPLGQSFGIVNVVVLEIASSTVIVCSYTNIADRHRLRAAIDHRQDDLVRPRFSWMSPSRRDVLVRAVFHRNARPTHNCQPECPDIRHNRQNKSRNTQRARDRHVRQPYDLVCCGPTAAPIPIVRRPS